MADVKIYTSMLCGYCFRAKALLKSKGVEYKEIDVSLSFDARREMKEKSGGGTSVPQIIIDDNPIGGCDELYALEVSGRLDQLLAE